MKIKAGVDLRGLTVPMAIAALVAEDVYRDAGRELVITSACDGVHMPGSLHGSGRALDLRTRAAGIQEQEAERIARRLRAALGEQFDVVVERDHVHVEFDPQDKE